MWWKGLRCEELQHRGRLETDVLWGTEAVCDATLVRDADDEVALVAVLPELRFGAFEERDVVGVLDPTAPVLRVADGSIEVEAQGGFQFHGSMMPLGEVDLTRPLCGQGDPAGRDDGYREGKGRS